MSTNYQSIGIAALLALVSACGGAEEDSAHTETEDEIYVASSRVWSRNDIPVCWENGSAGNARERGWVRDAVRRTWEAYSGVRFTEWDPCGFLEDGIHIRIADEGPHTKGLGSRLNRIPNGMVLNFTFRHWGERCRNDEAKRESCIRSIAVHEFGHALAFAHEQNRQDTPSWCDEEQGSDGDRTIGAWDLGSVMNYCNPSWTNGGRLSATDIDGVSQLYYGWGVSHSGMSAWTHLRDSGVSQSNLRYVNLDGDAKADAFRVSNGAWYVSYDSTGRWRRINSSDTPLSQLRFGDFDGDGRTDVFRTNGSSWYVSYRATGPWRRINRTRAPLSQLKFGDFDGDGRTDVLYTNGRRWLISNGGSSRWRTAASSGIRAGDLRTGDFNGDGRTDVFFGSGSAWKVVYSASGRWRTINRSGLRAPALRFGDFDGDGHTDVFWANGSTWSVAWRGRGRFVRLNRSGAPASQLGFADVDGDGATDVLRTRDNP